MSELETDLEVSRELAPARLATRGPSRDERGQVLVLAAIGLLVTVLAVLATVNLSEAVYQKIKLQNTADSAAYTAAAMEARTFNYIAFLNRAQIAHYNTAMLVQSYITWVGSHVALVGASSDIVMSLANTFSLLAKYWCAACASSEGECGYCCNLCTLSLKGSAWTGRAAVVRSKLVGGMAGIYQAAATIGHSIVEAMSIFNYHVIWKAQAWRAVLMNGQLLSGFRGYIEKNDPDESLFSGGRGALATVFNSALNSYEYYQAFDSSAGVNPQAFAFLYALPKLMSGKLSVCPKSMGAQAIATPGQLRDKDEDGAGAACRVMTNLVNASRYPSFVSKRGLGGGTNVLGMGFSMSMVKSGSTRFVPQTVLPKTPVVSDLTHVGGVDDLGVSLASDDYWGGSLSLSPLFLYGGLSRSAPLAVGDAILAWTEGDTDGPHYLYHPIKLEELLKMFGNVKGVQALVNIANGARERIAEVGGKVEKVWDDTWKHMTKAANQVTGDGKILPRPDEGSGLPGEMSEIEAALQKVEKAISTGQLALKFIQNAPAMIASYIKKEAIAQVKAMAQEAGKRIAKKLVARLGTSLFGPGGSLELLTKIMGALGVVKFLYNNEFGVKKDAPWPGFAPYFKFHACANRAKDFCQPSTWIFLSKPYDRFVKPEGKLAPSQSVFSWKNGNFTANIDTTAGWQKNIFMFEGLNVLARGRVYYHCMGNWSEQPNFFNPCWRAQLAPIGQKLTSYFSTYAGDAVGLTALPMGNQLQNLAMGAMGDLFAATVTSLVTH